jgi:hypothetical protein
MSLDDSWIIAEKFTIFIEPLPSSLITVNKLLLEKPSSGNTLSEVSKQSFKRLLASQSFHKSVEAFRIFYSPLLEVDEVTELRPQDLVGINLAIYFYSKLKSLVNPEDLAYILPRLSLELDLATALSLGFSGNSILDGVLTAAGRFFALGLIYKEDPKLYTEYRRLLRSRSFKFDEDFEKQKFKCTLSQIAVVICLTLGLSNKEVEGYVTGLSSELPPTQKSEYKFWILCKWLTNLIDTKEPPKFEHRIEFYPPTEKETAFFELLKTILSSSQGFSLWLEQS